MDLPDAGRVLDGRFEILELLTQDDIERVYRGRDVQTDGAVCVHVLRTDAAARHPGAWEGRRARYEREFEATHDLAHPNVVCAHTLVRDGDGSLYLVLDDAGTTSLADVLASDGPLAPERAIDVAAQVAGAIDAAYRRGVVHRDIKPEHVLLGEDGAARLTGFGCAQLEREARCTQGAAGHPGTPAYKSPEQAATTGYLDQRSDLYALALVLYEMLTGVVYAHRRVPPRVANPDVPAPLEAVVMRGLERDPEARYRSAEEFVADLRRVQSQSAWGQLAIVARRARPGRVAAFVGVLAVVLLSASLWRLGSVVSSQPPPGPGAPVVGALLPEESPPPGTDAETTGAGVAEASVVVDPYEPDDTDPAPISVGEVQRRAFDEEGDADRAVLRVKAGTSYVVFTDDLAPGVDTRLEVLVGGRSLINDDRSPGDLASEVTFSASSDGVAVITVTNQDRYGPDRTYALGVTAVQATPAPTATPTVEAQPTPSRTPRPTYTPGQPSPTPRATFTPRPTSTPLTPTARPSPSATRTPTLTRTPTRTPTPRQTNTPTNTPEPTNTPTPDRTPLPVRSPGAPTE